MSNSPEYSSTYVVQDRSNAEEMSRLSIQDQLITTAMGGVLPEQSDLTPFQKILDVGSGTGGWLIEAARNYPEMSLLIGAEVSGKMVEYARVQAEIQHVSDRVEFHAMDALRMLEFSPDFFDLVNLRFGASFMRTWEWAKLLQEFQRVTRRGGVIRITEVDADIRYSSPSLARLNGLLLDALSRAGHTFTSERYGKPDELVPLLQRHGVLNVRTQEHTIFFRAGTEEGLNFSENMTKMYRNFLPFLRKWLLVPNDYETIYQQALSDMQQPEFVAIWRVLTVWGTVPSK